MRVILSFFMLLTMAANCLAQDLEVPRIASVTVNPDGQPVIRWQMAAPSLVDGYIIKRLIVDGEGVISGTWNNVAVVEGGAACEYADNSESYSTKARPEIRQESYRISSYQIRDGRTYYSLMSDEASTISIDGRYDICSGAYSITCTSMSGALSYTLLSASGHEIASSQQPEFSVKSDGKTRERVFEARCLLPGGLVAGSPCISIAESGTEPPDVISINSVSALGGGQGLSVRLSLSRSPSVSRAVLCRNADTIELPPAPLDGLALRDSAASDQALCNYKIIAFNSCGQALAESAIVSNILLKVSQDGGANLLRWNVPDFAADCLEARLLCESDGNSETLSVLSPIAGEYSHHVADYYGSSVGKFCYQVLFYGADTCLAASNWACACQEPVMNIPNAFNPYSGNPDNRTFRPAAEFVDDYSLSVFDKRGALLFRSRELADGWDGRVRGSLLCPRDSYAYVITYRSADGRSFEKRGFVNLVY